MSNFTLGAVKRDLDGYGFHIVTTENKLLTYLSFKTKEEAEAARAAMLSHIERAILVSVIGR